MRRRDALRTRPASWCMCVSVRRLFLYFGHSIEERTPWAVFEPNNERSGVHGSDAAEKDPCWVSLPSSGAGRGRVSATMPRWTRP